MPRYQTQYGAVVEAEKPEKGWEPTTAALTDYGKPEPAGASSNVGGAIETGIRHAAEGAASMATAPLRAVGAGLELAGLAKRNPFTARGLFGSIEENTVGAEREAAQDTAHPIAGTVGDVAGAIAGAGPLGAIGGAAGGGVARALGGGLGARLARAATSGAVEGGTFGLADEASRAAFARQQIDGEHALAAAGLGALLGGSLSFASRGATEVFGAAARAGKRAISKLAEMVPGEETAAEAPLSAPYNDRTPDLSSQVRQTRYARGSLDVEETTELPIGGRPGTELEPEEARKALSAEGINTRNRVEKVQRLLDVVPEGAHPDWIMSMTPTQRRAMADFVGVPEASDVTWKALADAVGEREGIALPAEPRPPVESGTFAPSAPASVNAAAKKAFDSALKQMAMSVVKKGAGRMVGTLIGSTHGPVGALVGHQVGKLVDQGVERLVATDAFQMMAARAAKTAGRALDGALAIGTIAEPAALRLAAGARQTALPATMALFQGRHDSPEDAYEARVAELQGLAANNGDAIRQRIADSYGPIATEQPGAVAAASQTANAGVAYLLSKLPDSGPDPTSFTPLTDKRVPDQVDIRSFARIYSAVMQPKMFLRDVERGIATPEQHEAMKAVYPSWYDQQILGQLAGKLQQRDVKGKRLSSGSRAVVSQITGVSAGIDSDDFAVRYGNLFAGQDLDQKPSRNLSRKSQHQENYANTVTNDLLGSNQ